MGRTEWFRNNPSDPKAIRQEDVELWLRTWDSSVFWNMEEPLIFYREFGGTYWKKYFAGLKGVFYFINKLKLWRKDGFYRVGRYLVACVVYRVAALLGKEDRLIRRRSRPLPPEELLKAQEILKQALR